MFPSKFLQFPSILTHFHAANEKIQNGGRDLAISRGLVWVNYAPQGKGLYQYIADIRETILIDLVDCNKSSHHCCLVYRPIFGNHALEPFTS